MSEIPSGFGGSTVTFEFPEMRDGAASPVYRDGKYCGVVVQEKHESGCGWTFTASGPYCNHMSYGYRTPTDAALALAAHDDFGFEIK